MQYSEKLKKERYQPTKIPGRSFEEEMESDRGRAIQSAAVRRLQQKTQVFPLETNAAVRSRLTHSLEVQQVGRYISKLILKEMSEMGEKEADETDWNEFANGFVSAVEMACLLHDVGNPPFGHFGEEAINIWTQVTLESIFLERFSGLDNHQAILRDLQSFEGNAQGIRILHSLQSLNLTLTQLACLIKYTRGAFEEKPKKGDAFQYRKKKPGYYFSEKKLYETIRNELKIAEGCRFPLTYIMEAADDISYCIADLDDAVDKGIFTVERLHAEILDQWDEYVSSPELDTTALKKDYLPQIAESAMKSYQEDPLKNSHSYIMIFRNKFVNDLAVYAAKRYLENHQKIFDGSFDESLLDGKDEFHLATETLRNLALNKVFNQPEVENLELKGYAIISGLLKIYSPLIELSFSEFKKLALENRLKKKAIATRLYHKLSTKHKVTYLASVSALFSKDEPEDVDQMMEFYHRTRLIIDYISGMTDRYALDEFQNLSAIV